MSHQILEAQAEFALNLLRGLSNEGQETTIVSPISIAIGLSMVYAGAKGETAKQINKLLANGAARSTTVHQYFGQLFSSLCASQKDYTLEMANQVYLKDGFPIFEAFKSVIDKHYAGQLESVNFLEKEDTAKKMNRLIENATHGKIRDLIKAVMFTPITRLTLVNAIYFKSEWARDLKFQRNDTQKETFYVAEGKYKEVDMMQKFEMYIYQDLQDYKVLCIPYLGQEVSMFFILPRERFGLSKVLANLTGSKLLALLQNGHKEYVQVELPKFKLESTHDLNDQLGKLGIGTAFTDDANFRGISDAEELKEWPLKIDQVIQKAFIEVNEEGTEAAAATYIRMIGGGDMSELPRFKADHPFAFMLAYRKSHILFNGIFDG